MEYDILKTKPAAKFFYRGTHKAPVQRTVLLIESTGNVLKGYEVREGNTVRDIDEAPIKSFLKDCIATGDELRPDNSLRNKLKGDTTLTRMSMKQLEEAGV